MADDKNSRSSFHEVLACKSSEFGIPSGSTIRRAPEVSWLPSGAGRARNNRRLWILTVIPYHATVRLIDPIGMPGLLLPRQYRNMFVKLDLPVWESPVITFSCPSLKSMTLCSPACE